MCQSYSTSIPGITHEKKKIGCLCNLFSNHNFTNSSKSPCVEVGSLITAEPKRRFIVNRVDPNYFLLGW